MNDGIIGVMPGQHATIDGSISSSSSAIKLLIEDFLPVNNTIRQNWTAQVGQDYCNQLEKAINTAAAETEKAFTSMKNSFLDTYDQWEAKNRGQN